MAYDEYVLIKRTGKWWVMLDCTRQGPHATQDDALRHAMTSADIWARTGRQARIIAEHGEEFEVIYDTSG